MGIALIWIEGLAFALFALALAIGWSARGHWLRWLWPVAITFAFVAAAGLVLAQYHATDDEDSRLIRTPWATYAVTWLTAFLASSFFLTWHGRKRPEPGMKRPAAAWPRRRLWVGLGVSLLALAFTGWNLDLSARAELAVARQEAGAVLLAMTPPPVAEADNAARVYAEASKSYPAEIPDEWRIAARFGLDARKRVDWNDPSIAKMIKEQEEALALLRKGAAMPGCNFNHQRSLLDAASTLYHPPDIRDVGKGMLLLGIDARVKAVKGNLTRSFEDITAILRIFRHLSGYPDLGWSFEEDAWRALEEVLHLAPGKASIPALNASDVFPLVRKTREEHALLGMIFPAVASQPSIMTRHKPHQFDAASVFLIEYFAAPASRVFIIPDDVAALRKLIADYNRSPRTAKEETPQDWADLRHSLDNDPTSVFGIMYIKPKQRMLLRKASELATLRATAQAGLAVARYQRKHGKYPEQFEQLVPEFLSEVPREPIEGQPLQMKRVGDIIAVYSPRDGKAVDQGKVAFAGDWRLPAVFRLHAK